MPALLLMSPHALLLLHLASSIEVNPAGHVLPLSSSCSPILSLFLSAWLILFVHSLSLSLRADTWPGSGDQYQARCCRRTLSAATPDPCRSGHCRAISQTHATHKRWIDTRTHSYCMCKHIVKKETKCEPIQFKAATVEFVAGIVLNKNSCEIC